MATSDFRAYEKVMSQAEKNARQERALDRAISNVEKEAKAAAQLVVDLKKQNEILEKRLAYLHEAETSDKNLSDLQKEQLNNLAIEISKNEEQIKQLKERKELQAAFDADQVDAAKRRRDLEEEIKDINDKREKAWGKEKEKLDKELERLKKEKDNISNIDSFIDRLGDTSKNASNPQSGLGPNSIVGNIKYISDTLAGKNENTSAIGKGSKMLGEKLEEVKNPVAQVAGKGLELIGSIADCVLASRKALDSLVDSTASFISGMYGVTNAYLEGSGESADKLIQAANDMFGGSTLVKQTDYLKNIASLSSQGIAFNIEQRALLATIKDKALPTFDATNAALNRLVKLKKADMSQPFFGMEEILKRSLNTVFKDSSYLQNLYDSVNGILINSSSKQSPANVTAYNSTVQSWLGAMYESGVSDSVISNIAQAIDALGSGNVNSLQGNTTAQNLLLLSMDSIGMDYADILQNGLTAGTTNDLMKAMVDYLAKIAGNTEDNNVLRSAYGGIFNLTMADTEAIQNLASKTGQIYGSATTTSGQALQALTKSAGEIASNYTQAEKINNWLDNTKYDMGYDIASDTNRYMMWKTSNFLLDVINGIEDTIGGKDGKGISNMGAKGLEAMLNIAKAPAELMILGNAGMSLFQTAKDIWGGREDLMPGGNNTILDAMDIGLDTNIYGNFATGKSRSLYATTSRQGGNYIGLKQYDNQMSYDYLKGLNSNKFGYESADKYQAAWEQDDTDVLELLKSAMVQADEEGAHKAIAVYLAGMSDATLVSFASMLTAEDQQLIDMITGAEGVNVAYTNSLLSYAQNGTTSTQTTEVNSKATMTEPKPVA